MPTVTRLFLKSAFVYLLVALALGVVAAGRGGLWAEVAVSQFHLLAIGWLTQAIFGVAYWLFPLRPPRVPGGGTPPVHPIQGPGPARPARSAEPIRQVRGPEAPLAVAYGLLNVGLLVRAVGEPLFDAGRLAGGGWLLAASGVFQFAAAALFVWQIWPRVRERT